MQKPRNNGVSTMEPFDEVAYRNCLVEMGIPKDVAFDLARKMAKAQGLPTAQGTVSAVASASTAPRPAEPQSKPRQQDNTKKEKPPLTQREKALIGSGVAIETKPPTGDDISFMHSILCQVGLPRSKVDVLEFERVCGNVGLHVQAGKLWDGRKFVQQPIPYGPMPRLVMAYLNTYALRYKTPEIEVGNSASEFLRRLGKDAHGGKRGAYTTFRKQTQALAACRMTLGFSAGARAFTYDGKPIKQFEAWISNNDSQGALWPGVVKFSDEYYQTLKGHGVPMDLRALMALKGSALAMDIYAMLADRLHRISSRRPPVLHWKNLREQFGQEYQGKNADKNFKRTFLPALQKVLVVYPEAKVKPVTGGILMMPSPPPIPYKGFELQ